MKKMTLWLGSIAVAAAAATANVRAQDARVPAMTPNGTAVLGTRDVAAAPAADAAQPPAVVGSDGTAAGAPQYYSRAQIGDAPAQTTGAAAGTDSYGASLYGSSASGQREPSAALLRAVDKP